MKGDKNKMENTKSNKKWLTLIIVSLLGIIGVIFFMQVNSTRVFTKAEYVKEVIFQNKSFESALDKFLDQVISYNGSEASTIKLEETALKFKEFAKSLEEKLGSKVPQNSKSHYEKMMSTYEIYLQAIDMYVKAVPKNLGEERTNLMKEADYKLKEAQESMKNLEV